MAAPPLLEAALRYASRGRAVFPLRERAKQPLTPHGVKDASTDAQLIRDWWSRWPNANIGCATGANSGFWSLDIDLEGDGEATIRQLESEHGALPATVELITGGGGRQLFFRYDQPLGNSVRKLGPGIDTRGDGGYTILPPSVHPTGRIYAWSVDGDPADVCMAPAPDWLPRLLTAPTEAAPTPVADWRRLVREGVAEGERNAAVARLAGHLLRRYVDPFVVLDLIGAWNITKCRPPLPPAEVERTIESICARELRRRGAA